MIVILSQKDLVDPENPPKLQDVTLRDFQYFHNPSLITLARADKFIYHDEDRICILKDQESATPVIDSFENLHDYLA